MFLSYSKHYINCVPRISTRLTSPCYKYSAAFKPRFYSNLAMSPSLPKTQKVILIEENGESVDVLKYVDSPTPEITSPHDVIVKNQFAGVNFIEAYFRKGIYPVQLPAILGREASGVVAAVGDEVTKYKVGDKIAYLSTQTFAQYTKIQDSLQAVLPVGKDVSDEKFKAYGAILVQGLTALTFITEAHNVQKGEYILVWAAAGGVGRLLVQLISARGAHVIAIASTDEKLAVAKELGAEFVINSTTEDINAKVKEITGGKGVAATFDSVGKDSFDISFEALARKGTFVSYGNSSGVVPPLPINKLSPKNIKLTRPQLFGYVAAPEEWEHYTSTLLKLIDSGELKFELHTAKLEDYKQVATNLESRKTTGKIVLEIPQ